MTPRTLLYLPRVWGTTLVEYISVYTVLVYGIPIYPLACSVHWVCRRHGERHMYVCTYVHYPVCTYTYLHLFTYPHHNYPLLLPTSLSFSSAIVSSARCVASRRVGRYLYSSTVHIMCAGPSFELRVELFLSQDPPHHTTPHTPHRTAHVQDGWADGARWKLRQERSWR